MEDEIVPRQQWLSHEEFLDVLSATIIATPTFILSLGSAILLLRFWIFK